VRILTITSQLAPYAHTIMTTLKKAGILVELDESGDPISGQIKRAQLERIPWMLVLGKKEMENNTITLRTLDGKQEFGLTLEQLLERARHALQ
jgi:threonyl-tRNA synthetase